MNSENTNNSFPSPDACTTDVTPSGLGTMTTSIENADNYNRWILNVFRPYIGKRILEVGTGRGNLPKYLPDYEVLVSCDINEKALERARHMNPDVRYQLLDTTDCTFCSKLKPNAFDTVLCLNVLEHISDDGLALRHLLDVLIPGGHLLLLVPALPCLFGDMDRLAGHFRRYTKTSLRSLLNGSRESVIRLRYFNSVGGVGWWMNKMFTHRNLDSKNLNVQVKLFDRFVVPMARSLDPLTRAFFGQSLICVVQRR